MSRLIFHIGMPKTGSSAIFSFLRVNSEALAKQGFCKPVVDGLGPLGRRVNGRLFFSACGKYPGGLSPDAMDRYLDCLRDAAASFDTVILIDELSWRRPSDIWKLVREKAESLGFSSVQPILYLRRPDEHFGSLWKENCKREDCVLPSPSEFFAIALEDNLYDYLGLIDSLELAFSRENILLRVYDRKRFVQGNVFRDFCDAVGIVWDDNFRQPTLGVNRSLSFDVTEAIRRLSLGHKMIGNKAGWLLRAYLLFLSKRFPDAPGMALLGQEDARALLQRYAESYETISERYFDGKPLFEDSFDCPVWTPDEERIGKLERRISLAGKLLAPLT